LQSGLDYLFGDAVGFEAIVTPSIFVSVNKRLPTGSLLRAGKVIKSAISFSILFSLHVLKSITPSAINIK
jgi:hypothetical protein